MVVNPIAGCRGSRAVLRRAVRRMREAGLAVEVMLTERAGHAGAWAAALDPSTHAAVVVGGDGTVREVIDGLAGKPVPLALLPTGTENLIAKAFGFRFDADALCRRIEGGTARRVDVGVLNGQHFLAVVGVGFDAEVVERLRAGRTGHITHGSYFWPLWRTFWEHRFPPLCIVADGETIFEGPGLAFAANLPQYAVGLPICPNARWDDGRLDLCVFPCDSQGRLLVHAVRTVLKRHLTGGGVLHRRCRRIRITSPRCVPMEADGDSAGRLPAELTVHAAHVTVLCAAVQET